MKLLSVTFYAKHFFSILAALFTLFSCTKNHNAAKLISPNSLNQNTPMASTNLSIETFMHVTAINLSRNITKNSSIFETGSYMGCHSNTVFFTKVSNDILSTKPQFTPDFNEFLPEKANWQGSLEKNN